MKILITSITIASLNENDRGKFESRYTRDIHVYIRACVISWEIIHIRRLYSVRYSKCEYIFVGPLRCRKVRSRGSCHAINIAFASKPPLRSNTTRSRTISEHYFDPSLRLKNILVILSSISITKYRSEQISRKKESITCMHIPVHSLSFHEISNLRQALRYGKILTKKKKINNDIHERMH